MVLLAVSMILLAVTPRRAAPSPAVVASEEAQLADLRRQVDELEREEAKLLAKEKELASARAAASAAPSGSADPFADDDQWRAASQLTLKLEAEPRDAAWAPRTEAKFEAAAAKLTGLTLRSITCRKTFCGAVFGATSRDAATSLPGAMNDLVGGDFTAMYAYRASAPTSVEARVFFSRPGRELPSIAPR